MSKSRLVFSSAFLALSALFASTAPAQPTAPSELGNSTRKASPMVLTTRLLYEVKTSSSRAL